jgi:hypothetical protein
MKLPRDISSGSTRLLCPATARSPRASDLADEYPVSEAARRFWTFPTAIKWYAAVARAHDSNVRAGAMPALASHRSRDRRVVLAEAARSSTDRT